MLFPLDKSLFISFYFISLITLTSSNKIPQRFLQGYSDPDFKDNSYNNTTNGTSTSITEDPGSYLLAWFVIFFFIGLYMVCSMKKYPSISHRTDEVWKFMFFANNGILVASSVNVFNIKNLIIDSSPFALSTIVFIIGCIYYIAKYCQTCSMEFAYKYFQCDYLGELYKIPCFVWSLIGLTDPCCRSNTYTVTIYADGHTESNECCMRMWNCFIYVIKRLALIFSIVSFYIFLLFYFIFWLIAKSIYLLVLKCKIEKEENPEIQNQQPQVNTRNAININDIYIYGSQDEINNNNNNGIGQQPGVQTVTINQNNNNNNYNNTERNQNMNNDNINNIYYDTNNNINNNNDNNNINYDTNNNNNNILNVNSIQNNNHNHTNMFTITTTNNDQNNQNENTGPSRILPKKEEEEQIPKPSPDGESRENIQSNDVDNKDNFETIKQSEVGSNNGMDEAPAPGFDEVDKK